MINVAIPTDDTLTYDEVAPSLNNRDIAGNPTNPIFNAALYSDTPSIRVRSLFTDKGPIAKPLLVLQSGVGAVVNTVTEVTLPGASLTSAHVGLYVRLGQRGLLSTSTSAVVGFDVAISEAISIPDSLKVEIFRPSSIRTVYTTLSGTYKIVGVLTSTRVRLQASFTLPEGANGTLYWDLVDPRNGQIADDPADVTVRINGTTVVPDAVIGLLGQIVLPVTPSPTDNVQVDYAWCFNPTVECRRLNSKEFRLNFWDRNKGLGANTEQHRYRYNNVLVKPSSYVTLNSLGRQVQPKLRELHYRAYERAYTPVFNDPTTLLLNSPTHKIAYPSSRREVSEEFVVYEGTVLPENDTAPWVRHGTGVTTISAGVLTVVDNSTGVFPTGQSIFWTKALDLTFPSAFALSWRMLINSVPVLDGVFTGVGAGYSDDLLAFVVGFLDVGGVKKIGFLKRGFGDNPSVESSWTGGLDTDSLPTGLPVEFDWSVLHSYRLFKDPSGVVHLLVDGNIVDSLRITTNEAPFLEELNAPFDELQGVFFGSLSRVAENSSDWDFIRYLILPTNPIQTSPSSFVNYEGTVNPEVATKPWTPVGYHGTETILGGTALLLDSTSATDVGTSAQVGLIGGDFRGFVRMEPLLLAASQVVLDVDVQLRTYTHGIDPYGLLFAVDDGSRLIQVAFLASSSTPKLSYGGRSFPEDFSPYVWSSLGTATASMIGRVLRITDSSTSTGKVYFIDDLAPPLSDARVVDVTTDYFLEFRCRMLSYTADPAGFAGAVGQVSDGTRSIGIMLEDIGGTKYVTLHSDGIAVPSGQFAFNWGSAYHTYRLAKNTAGNLVSLFVDGAFLGSVAYSAFAATPGTAVISFGSSTSSSVASRSVTEWAYCNAWRTRSDLKRYVGIWKGFDDNALTGYHLPVKTTGIGAQVAGNGLGDSTVDFIAALVTGGDQLIVDVGSNKGVYTIAAVIDANNLTISGSWPVAPSVVSYRIIKETDWSTSHKYRLTKDSTGEVDLFLDAQPDALIRIGYNSIDLPESGVGIVKTLSNGLASIVFGSFSPEDLEQSWWDFVRYGITRTPTEREIAPHHQVLNQWNVMESPELLTTTIPHPLTSYKSSSTGITPKIDPDFLANTGLSAFTQLNDGTPLVPSTQTYEVRKPYPVQTNISTLSTPSDVMANQPFTINDGEIQYELILPDDILYSSLDVIEQTTGDEAPITPFGDHTGPTDLGIQYTKRVCLNYVATTLPENDTASPTPWSRHSDVPSDVMASVLGGILTYQTIGSRTAYLNNTPLPDAPSLVTEVRFRLRLIDDATLGTGDTKVRFGLSAPGLTVALAFVTTVMAERYVLVVDLNSGNYLGSVSFDFLDGAFHNYRIVRDPGAGVVQVFIDA
jgi:hypothetical protein